MKNAQVIEYTEALRMPERRSTPAAPYVGRLVEGQPRFPTWKRVFDLTWILLTMPVWLTLMIITAVWIKVVSPGPVIFRQERIGYRGRRFMILKFRSMKVNVETATHEQHLAELLRGNRPMTKLDSRDDRLIRGAKWLRAAGIDELPQLFNVLRGEMTLVGPRPCTRFEFSQYRARHKSRVNAPPGLTGYWQVNGKNKTTHRRMVAMDLIYAKKMSAWLDLNIIVKTIPALLTQVVESKLKRGGKMSANLEAPNT
jgi:exopolysaccharide production protein ExoY